VLECGDGRLGTSRRREESRGVRLVCRDARLEPRRVAHVCGDVLSEHAGAALESRDVGSALEDVVSEDRERAEALRNGWLGVPSGRLGSSNGAPGVARRRLLEPRRPMIETSQRLGSSSRRLALPSRRQGSSSDVPTHPRRLVLAPRGRPIPSRRRLGAPWRSQIHSRRRLADPGHRWSASIRSPSANCTRIRSPSSSVTVPSPNRGCAMRSPRV